MKRKGFASGQKIQITAEAIKLQRKNVIDKYFKEVNSLKKEITALVIEKESLSTDIENIYLKEKKELDLVAIDLQQKEDQIAVFSDRLERDQKRLIEQAKLNNEINRKELESIDALKRKNESTIRQIREDREEVKGIQNDVRNEKEKVKAAISENQILINKLTDKENDILETMKNHTLKMSQLNNKNEQVGIEMRKLEETQIQIDRELIKNEDARKEIHKKQVEIKESLSVLKRERKWIDATLLQSNKLSKALRLRERTLVDRDKQLDTREKAMNIQERKLIKRERNVKIVEEKP